VEGDVCCGITVNTEFYIQWSGVRLKDDRVRNGTPSRDHKGRENDIFRSQVSPLKGNSPGGPIGVGDTQRLIDKKGRSPQVFSVHRRPLSPLPVHSLDADDNTESDMWVDTDADGSELDLNSESDEVFLQPAAIAP